MNTLPGPPQTRMSFLQKCDWVRDKCEDCCRGQLTQWDVFMRQMQPLAAQMPWMLIEGVSGVCMTTNLLHEHQAFRILRCMHWWLMMEELEASYVRKAYGPDTVQHHAES